MSVLFFLSDRLYSNLLIFLLIAAGLFFTLRSGFVQLRLFPEAWRVIRDRPQGGMSSFEALMLTTASRVGTGNVAGVATAIALGGPGAIFWMWLLAILGSASAFVESTLGQIYKVRCGAQILGGPAYYLQLALHQRWLGVLFSVLLIACFAFGFNGLQAFQILDTLRRYLHSSALSLRVARILLVALTALSLFGGSSRISAITARLVPFMAGLYLLLAVIVTVTHAAQVPAVLAEIFRSAFDFDAFSGGFSGSCIVLGIKRGLFSNEAGMGSGPNATSSAAVSHPVKQGLVSVLSVFLDTIVICSASAFLLLLSGVQGSGALQGMPLMQQALHAQFGDWGVALLSISVCLFAFTSILGNAYYIEINVQFLTARRSVLWLVRISAVVMVFLGTWLDAAVAWHLADLLMGLMGLVNLYAIFRLGPIAMRALQDYQRQRAAGKDPVFRAAAIGVTDTVFWK